MNTHTPKPSDLAKLVKEIGQELEFKEYIGKGDYGIVLKVAYQNSDLKLKVNWANEVEGRTDTLEREYQILEDLAKKTNLASKPIKLYDNVRCVWYNTKGKHAYLSEFIEGKPLSKSGKQSEISLTIALNNLMDEVHKAGYEFGSGSDLNPDNLILDKSGNLRLIDPMFLIPLKEKSPKTGFYMSAREKYMRDVIIRRCT